MRFTIGFGVDLVVAEQAEYFLKKNNRVSIFVKVLDDYYSDRFEKYLSEKMLSIQLADSLDNLMHDLNNMQPDVIFFHTPPFYSLIPELKGSAVKVFYDYGEPPPENFPDKEERIIIRDNKKQYAEDADIRFSISKFIQKDSGIKGSNVNWLGNDHFIKKSYDLKQLQRSFRKENKLHDKFVILNVSRYYYSDRHYKGIDKYIEVRDSFFSMYPLLKEQVVFVIAGASGERDRDWASSFGLLPFSNLSEEELVKIYLDADIYLSTSMWEGYNLGIAQALSFGLPVIASDKGAHSEFGIDVGNDPEFLAEKIYNVYMKIKTQRIDPVERLADQTLFSWEDSVKELEDIVDQLVEKRIKIY